MWTTILIFSTFTSNKHNGFRLDPFYFGLKLADLPSWQSLQEIFYHSSLFYATQRFWPHNRIWYKNDSTWCRSINLHNINQGIKHKKQYIQFNENDMIKNIRNSSSKHTQTRPLCPTAISNDSFFPRASRTGHVGELNNL